MKTDGFTSTARTSRPPLRYGREVRFAQAKDEVILFACNCGAALKNRRAATALGLQAQYSRQHY